MSYVLGYIIADGCILIDKKRKRNPFMLNITSAEKDHINRIRKVLNSNHKIGEKRSGSGNIAFQLQIRNLVLTQDLIRLGVVPRKTYHLDPIRVPRDYFSDFVRGFFDGDGSVYIYMVNDTPQMKSEFASSSAQFLTDLNIRISEILGIPPKAVHKKSYEEKERLDKYNLVFYVYDAEKLFHFMYGSNPLLYLPRKRRIFERWQSISRRLYTKKNYPSKIGWHLKV